MKNCIRGFIVFSALACAVSLSAQTADEIVQKYLEAIGGKSAISQVKSLSMETAVQIMGNDAPSKTVILDGVGYRTDTEFNGVKLVQCYTETGGWMVNPMTGSTDPAAMPEDQYKLGKAQIYIGGALYDYAARGGKVELLSKETNAYKIKLTSKDNVDAIYVIDPTTYLVKSVISKGKMQDQDVEITSSFSDYRKTDVGYLLPYSIDLDLGGQFSLSIAVKKVELNKTIDPAIFAMPKSASPPSSAPPSNSGNPKQ